jgi:hypothetical protein
MDVDGGRPRSRARVPVDYPSNSKKAQEGNGQTSGAPKKNGPRESVLTGKAKMKKPRGEGGFFQETGKSLGMYIVNEVIIPNVKSLIVDIMTNGSERAVWGNSRPRGATRGGGPYNYSATSRGYGTTTYPSVGNATPTNPTLSKQNRAIHNFNEIILETREDAERILLAMDEIIVYGGRVTVGDYLQLCGFEANFAEEQWGWTDLQNASVHAVRGGYMIRLPRTVPISLN